MVEIPTNILQARQVQRVAQEKSKKNAPSDPTRVYSRASNTPAHENSDAPLRHDKIPVRRPGYGVFPQKPSWATLEVVSLDGGEPIEIFNSCYRGGMGPGTTNFILQNMRWAPAEATQIVRSFGDWYLSDIGEDPDILLVGGVLLESANFPYFREWQTNWHQYLRARRAIINRTEIHLTIDQVTWRGYAMNCEASRSHSFSASWMVMPFSFQIILRDVVDNTSDGIQVGPTAETLPTETPVVSFYRDQFTPDADSLLNALSSAGINALSTAESAFGLELISGESQDSQVWQEGSLEYPGRDEDMIYELNIARLTAIASAINIANGRQTFDVGQVRRGLIARQNAALASRGLNDPYGQAPELGGFRDRVARNIENGVDSVLSSTVKSASDILW